MGRCGGGGYNDRDSRGGGGGADNADSVGGWRRGGGAGSSQKENPPPTMTMRRSPSSSIRSGQITPPHQRRSIFPSNGGHAGFDYLGSLNSSKPSLSSKTSLGSSSKTPNATAASMGRSLLGRPKLDTGICRTPENLLLHATFTASAAKTPLPRVLTRDKTLKSCLSSSGVSALSMGSVCRFRSSSNNNVNNAASASSNSKSANKNEEFKLPRKISFSHEQIREYEVTLGDNPSVSSGAPLSLGWRYNPQESITSLSNNNNDKNSRVSSESGGRSMSELKLSDRERHRRVSANPNVSMQELHEVLQSVATTRFERKESLNELREQMMKRR